MKELKKITVDLERAGTMLGELERLSLEEACFLHSLLISVLTAKLGVDLTDSGECSFNDVAFQPNERLSFLLSMDMSKRSRIACHLSLIPQLRLIGKWLEETLEEP